MTRIEHLDRSYEIDRIPDACPLCHFAVQPAQISAHSIPSGDVWKGSTLEVVYRCPRHECSHLFIARYRFRPAASPSNWGGAVLEALVPWLPRPPMVPEEVRKLSTQFVQVLAEAEWAEALGMLELAGVGHRKGLEFLVKDYCILLHPNEAEKIKPMFLGQCIQRYIADENIRACAERAAWLGNDEAHYARLWEVHDLADLKALLVLTVSWIQTSLLRKRYLAEMPRKAT